MAKTPPPTTETATATTKTVIQTQQKQKQEEQKQRLLLYNSLFGQDKNKFCDKTGLRFISSLNYSLQTILHLNDKILDIINY